ncbi:Imm50 family immunity protein [Actinacidiphila paucisporea]|uniref:Immunity protein 50 n=1 Tax=Actinacidiphila paucisporea TaxID=310782 RepID=A0A1M7N3C3_9ACTN|nr:Imm50 family immunity protein [Actinacidiphila paucisporea]SHM97476.1 Immunity protein 50 [Actinacidiphila paucisporea]
MTPAWAGLVRNLAVLTDFYTSPPPLEPVTVRSLYLDRRGPTLTLRFDLSGFPDRPRPEWEQNGCDMFQCQLQFLAVDDFLLRGWHPPVTGSLDIEPTEERRVLVRLGAGGTRLTFSSSDSLTVGKMSAYRSSADGTDRGHHYYVGKVDQMRYDVLPDLGEKTFYGRV